MYRCSNEQRASAFRSKADRKESEEEEKQVDITKHVEAAAFA